MGKLDVGISIAKMVQKESEKLGMMMTQRAWNEDKDDLVLCTIKKKQINMRENKQGANCC